MIEQALSPRGRFLFFILCFSMLGYVFWHRFAESGIAAWMDNLQAQILGGFYSPKLSVVLLLFPILALSAGPAFLHDYVFRVGVFSPDKK